MAKLSVRLHGSEIALLDLEPGNEYVAGRAQDAQIILPQQRGISRQHLKFYFQDEHWVCEALSKFLLIQIGDKTMEVLELTQDTVFVLPPFEFHFELEEVLTTEAEEAPPKPIANPPTAVSTPRFSHPNEDTRPQLNNEATMAGVSSLVPYLRITSVNSSDEETLKLEGHLWVAGREPSNEIHLDTPHASRKHFEIVRTNEGFFITDLGSANGTNLNGQRLAPHEPTKIESGDSISVQNIAIVFEIRDTQFTNRVSNLPVAQPSVYEQPMPMAWPQPTHYQPPPAMDEEEFTKSKFALVKKHLNWKEHKVRVVIVAMLPILLYGLFSRPSGDKNRNPATAPQTPSNVPFEQMNNEQKNAIKDSFNLARNLYVQGKYELCITEITKLHTMIPFFENSKELEEFCKQGRELVIRQKDLERKERERAMIELQIKEVVEACDVKVPKTAGVEETRRCLMEAIELDPEHAAITEALANAQRREEERKIADAEKEANAKRAGKGQQQFARAKALAQQDKLYKALKEYEDYIVKNYPNSDSNKEIARREIAAIKNQLKAKVGSKLEECKSLGDKGQFKNAYLACNSAVEEDPGNQQARETREDMLNGLRKEMKSIYEDSVLEESMGNVDAAKEKWNKIIKENLPSDDYTVKSKVKLQKYNGN